MFVGLVNAACSPLSMRYSAIEMVAIIIIINIVIISEFQSVILVD